MQRRNTIDCYQGASWPICQYYYTHNTGSCDDILLYQRNTPQPDPRPSPGAGRSVRVRKKRRYTYPVVLLNQRDYTRQFIEHNNTKTPGLLLRRWSTSARQKKRRTLADIISTLAASGDKLESTDNNDGNKVKSMATETRLSSIQRLPSKGDKTQLQHEEKLENPRKVSLHDRKLYTPVLRVVNQDKAEADEKAEDSASAINVPHTEANTSATLMDSGVNINSSLIAHPPSVNSTNQGNYVNQDQTTNTNYDRDSSSHRNSDRIDEELASIPMFDDQRSSNTSSSFDMFMFLFGFLFFPLWWVGAWKYIMQTQTKSASIPKHREVFQILNCCMSLASLLLLGLIIGLVTVWA